MEPQLFPALRDEALDIETAILDAFASGSLYHDSSAFDSRFAAFQARVDAAYDDGTLDPETGIFLHTVVSRIVVIYTRCIQHEAHADDLQARLHSDVDTTLRRSCSPELVEISGQTTKGSLPFAWVQPLLEFMLNNLSHPYPSAEEKQLLLDEAQAAGWESVSSKKLDEWMHLTRSRMGYTALLKCSAVDEDRDMLADIVCRVIHGEPQEIEGIPVAIVHGVEDMMHWIQEQYESKSAKEQTSAWARDIEGLMDELAAEDADPDLESPNDVEEDAFSSDDETQYSDDSSDFSDTDVEPWVDEPLRGIIGTKRKYSGLQGLGFPTSSPLSRSSSSSSLSSRGRSIWSRRSSSGSTSASSVFSVDWEQEQREETDRPTKRRRNSVELPSYDPSSPAASSLEDKSSPPSHVDASSSDSLLHETTSPCSSSSPPSAQSPEPIPFPSSALFPAESPAIMAAGSMLKRKRAASDDEDARPVVSKRRRHSASPPSIPMQHFGALGIIGHLPWNMSPCASSAVELELEAYALDSSPFAHGVAPEPLDDADEEEGEEEEEEGVYDGLVDYSNERMLEEVVEDGTPGTFTWSEMQLHVLDSILSYGARPTPAATATRNAPLSSPQGFRVDLPSLDDDDLAYLLNIAAGPPMPPPAEMISPPLPSMDNQTFDLDADVKPPLPESDVDYFVRTLQGWTNASTACPIRLEEPAPFADAEADKWAVDFLAAASADLMTH